MRDRKATSSSTWTYLAAGLLAIGFLLRLMYALRIYPFVDEYITTLAVQMVLQKGVPVMPSGQFYEHGLIHIYLGAISAALLGPNLFALRLPGLLITLPTLWITFRTGQRWFSPRAGLLALALLALSPDAIEWGGRARLYSLWQLFTLVGVILLYEGLLGNHSKSARCLALLSLTGAILCHLLTLILFPPLAAGLLLAWLFGRKRGLRLWVPRQLPWAEIATLAICLVILLLLVRFDRPGGAETLTEIQTESLVNPLKLASDLLIGGWQFWKTPYWLTSIIWIVALVAVLLRLCRREHTAQDARMLYLSIAVLVTVVEFSLITSVFARRLRYVFNLLPLYFLAVGFGLDALILPFEQAAKGMTRQLARWAPLVLVIGLFGVPALTSATQQRFGGDLSFGYVHDHWQAGDVVATHLTATAQVALGRCDYFVALSQPFIRQADDGSWTDPFLGLPWLSTAQELREAVTRHPRTWLVVEKNLADDYEAALGDWATLALETWDINVYLVQSERTP
jgi:4-amino-4-deoxy-L-arabinose transferase-like glycosyltransferase